MLSSRIAFLRTQAGLSQAALASRLGVSASAVGMYEQGRREPSNDLLVALARTFDVSTDYLLTGSNYISNSCTSLSAALLGSGSQRKICAAKAPDAAFSREEFAVLLAALLLEG